MGFFKKLFRRRKKKKGRRDDGAFLQSQPDNVHHNHGNMIRKPAFNKNPSTAYDSFKTPHLNSTDSRSRTSGTNRNNIRGSHDSSYGSSYDSREESYFRPGGSGSRQSQTDHFGHADFQADFSGFNHKNNGNYGNTQSPMNIHGRSPHERSQAGSSHNNNTLKYDQVQKFEKDQARQGNNNPYGQPLSNKPQLTRLPNGQLVPMDNINGKGATSLLSPTSDFDLSTDAEDNEYNEIRTYDANGNMKTMLGSPRSHSDEDPELFGGNNKMYMSNSESEHGSFQEGPQTNRSRHYFSDSERESPDVHRTSMGNVEGRSPNKDLSPQAGSKFTFDTEFTDPTLSKSKDSTEHPPKAASPDGRSGDGPSPRTIAIQQAQKMRIQGNFTDDNYADSTDSENDAKNKPKSSASKKIMSPTHPPSSDGIIENFVDFENNAFESRSSNGYSKSVVEALSPVSKLIAQAEERRKRKGTSSHSISSAPNMNDPRRLVPRPSGRSSAAAAREKLQKRRKEKREWLKSNGGLSDDDSDNGKDNESWLHNEVSGALGPQGIQADLESLGERSYRSRNSIGNKSQRSHRSHRSSSRHNRGSDASVGSRHSRRNKGSDASVGSRHSRASRTSRASRYSIKSTKSHLSAMSVESRSVANDLIRLEMQLAMFSNKSGENTVKKDLENEAKKKGISGLTVNRRDSSGSVGGGSIGARSKSSARSNYNHRARPVVSKRLKSTVKAPPGKLGIILANKNDGKGTVVSGVRTTSVLVSKVSPGDRIIAIDGEDVSRMTVTEITSIMSRKGDYDRMLTVLSSN